VVHRRLLLLLLVITALKLALATIAGASQQVVELRAQAETFLEAKNVYDPRNTAKSPSFFLLGNYLLAAACLGLSHATRIPFEVTIKGPAILADLGIAWILLRAGRSDAALWYLLSPVTLLLSVYHGQLHTVALLGCVAALRLVELGHPAASGAALAVATGIRQHFAALAVPLTRDGSGFRGRLLLAFVAVTAALSLPLLSLTDCVTCPLAPALNYGAWGYGLLLLQGPRVLARIGLQQPADAMQTINGAIATHASVIALVWPAVFGLASLVKPHTSVWRAAFVYILGLYVFTPGVAVQWLVWALPFFLLLEPRCGAAYSALAGAFLIGSYWKWTLNAAHGVYRLTAHLEVVSRTELLGLVLVGAVGLTLWGLCALLLMRHFGR
jgi:hypothetical protein